MDGYRLRRAVLRAILITFALLAISPSHALPVIQEIYYDHPGSDAGSVFTELYGEPNFDLSGWQLVGINGANGLPYRTLAFPNLQIPDDGILVISTTQASSALAAQSDYQANVDWQNGVDALQLWNEIGEVIDAVQYGTLSGFFSGEGDPTSDVSAGTSLSRHFAGFDTNNNLNDFLALSAPTPGSVVPAPLPTTNLVSVPVSSSVSLLLSGLMLLVFTAPTARRTNLSC